MKVELRYFASIRETLGRGEETREVPSGTTAGALFETLTEDEPRLTRMRSSTMLMVNQQYARPEHVLEDGDEVALIPPVSGGGEGFFRVGPEPLDVREVEAAVGGPGAGAIVTFTGTVRDHGRGRRDVALEYEAYPVAAEGMLRQIGREIHDRWGVTGVAIAHRTGWLPVGEASVVIAVASPHRGEGFAAAAHAIKRLKEIVPIWKKEHYEDGSTWIGSEADYQRETGRLPASANTR